MSTKQFRHNMTYSRVFDGEKWENIQQETDGENSKRPMAPNTSNGNNQTFVALASFRGASPEARRETELTNPTTARRC